MVRGENIRDMARHIIPIPHLCRLSDSRDQIGERDRSLGKSARSSHLYGQIRPNNRSGENLSISRRCCVNLPMPGLPHQWNWTFLVDVPWGRAPSVTGSAVTVANITLVIDRDLEQDDSSCSPDEVGGELTELELQLLSSTSADAEPVSPRAPTLISTLSLRGLFSVLRLAPPSGVDTVVGLAADHRHSPS